MYFFSLPFSTDEQKYFKHLLTYERKEFPDRTVSLFVQFAQSLKSLGNKV